MNTRAGKSVFGVNAAVSVALVVLVAAIALVVNPPAPPGIAAFAPQASKPITKAPLGQSSNNGSGAGQCAAGQHCTRPGATPSAGLSSRRGAGSQPTPSTGQPAAVGTGGAPSALACYSWPDGSVTQTFDPQSPPCVASWPGQAKGNGGATSTGVTATEIRLAFPKSASASAQPLLQHLVDFYNTHYELYGRKIVLVPFTSNTIAGINAGGSNADPQPQHADAAEIGSLKVFAATDFDDGPQEAIALPTYADGLADHHVIGLLGGEQPPSIDAAHLASHSPYEWSYEPTVDQLFQATGGLTCSALVGHAAVHSGGYRKKQRTFALLLPDEGTTGGQLAGLTAFRTQLEGCGVADPKVVYYQASGSGGGTTREALVQLRSEGITSLLYFPWYYSTSPSVAPQSIASQIGYQPEWITMSWQSTNTSELTLNEATKSSTFGVAGWNKLAPPNQLPWWQAYVAAGADPSNQVLTGANAFYHELGVLAAGVQGAGPDLMPSTFARALHQTTFPNPGAGAAPTYQGTVGFGEGDVMVDDFVAWWFPSSASFVATEQYATNYDPYPDFCYVGLGKRATAQTWPHTDGFYQGGCT